MKKDRLLSNGFSLVEVTIALGIVAFVLMALFALLPIGLNLVRESSEEGVAANILSGLASDLKNSGATETVAAVHQIPIGSVGTGVVYFDMAGRLLEGAPTNSAGFKATWSVRSRDVTNGIPSNVHLHVSWPAGAEKPTGFVETLIALKNNPTNS